MYIYNITQEIMADTKLTTVKILKEIYSNFKKVSFDGGTTLQKLVNRSMDRYVNEDEYRTQMDNYTYSNVSGSQY
jgi:hypothetical protein